MVASHDPTIVNTLTRRGLLTSLAAATAAVLGLAACSQPPSAAPTAAPAPPAPAAAPTAAGAAPAPAAPTAAPAATVAPTPATVAAAPTRGGDLVVTNRSEPISLDPANINGPVLNTANAMYDTLVYMGKDAKYYPSLAQSWDITPDGKTYTFKLKNNVKFHDGTPFNAAAVKFSLEHATSPGMKAQLPLTIVGAYDRTEVVDDLTARVVLKQPYGPFLTALAQGYYAIVSPTAVAKFGPDYDTHPVGTGPFIFVEWVPTSHVTVKKNPDYAWGSEAFQNRGAAHLDTVSFRLIPDATIRATVVETGEAQIGLEINTQDVDRLKSNNALSTIQVESNGWPGWLTLNTTIPPLDDLNVRRAMEWAIDREELCKVMFNNLFTPARTLLQPASFAYDKSLEEIYPKRDVDKAKDLLTQSGYALGSDGIFAKDGKQLEIVINILSTSLNTEPYRMATLIQAQMQDAGIIFTPKQYDEAAIFAMLMEGSQMVDRDGHGSSPDPDGLRSVFLSTMFKKNANARIGVNDPHLDELLMQGATETDQTKRKGIYREIQQIALDQAYVVPMWNFKQISVVRAAVKDLAFDPFGYIHLNDTSLG